MDPRLIVRAQRGDERAFADLTTAIGAQLHRVAYGILRDRDLAEDAMQAALVQIWRKLPSLRDPSRFEALVDQAPRARLLRGSEPHETLAAPSRRGRLGPG